MPHARQLARKKPSPRAGRSRQRRAAASRQLGTMASNRRCRHRSRRQDRAGACRPAPAGATAPRPANRGSVLQAAKRVQIRAGSGAISPRGRAATCRCPNRARPPNRCRSAAPADQDRLARLHRGPARAARAGRSAMRRGAASWANQPAPARPAPAPCRRRRRNSRAPAPLRHVTAARQPATGVLQLDQPVAVEAMPRVRSRRAPSTQCRSAAAARHGHRGDPVPRQRGDRRARASPRALTRR